MIDLQLHEQIVFKDKPRIDREKGKIYKAHVLGPVSANGYSYSIDGMREVYTKYESMPVGLNHDYNSSPLKVESVWGELSNPTVDSDGIWADLSYLRTHPLTEQILEDVERDDTALFSLSSVNSGIVQKGKVVEHFSPIRCDLVVRGACTKTLLEQAKLEQANEIKNEIKTEEIMENKLESTIDTIVSPPVGLCEQQQQNDLKDLLIKLEQKVIELEKQFAKREQLTIEYLAPKVNLEQTIVEATKNIDLSKFWKE